MVDDCSEGYALRGALEVWGFRVNVFPIGRPGHLVEVLDGSASNAPYVILSCHGTEQGICLPELDSAIAKEEPFHDILTAETLATFVCLPGRIVVSTGCSTGNESFGRAFLHGGCAAYIAPRDYPEGSSALFFVLHLFYGLTRKCPLSGAFEAARSHDEETGMFRLFS
jgi:hypothetical protein